MAAGAPIAVSARRDGGVGAPIAPFGLGSHAIRTYRDEAIVLRTLDYGEADRILTLLTGEHGKVGAIAKGARRQPSRLGPALQVFHHLDVQLATGHNLDVVTQAVPLPGPRIRADIEWTARAAVICELADSISEERHPERDVFQLTLDSLHDLAEESEPRRATAHFLMNALLRLGYGPRLRECAGCGRPLPEWAAAFSPEAGGFLCADCARPGMALVPVQTIKVLRVLEAGDIDLYRRLKLSDELLSSLEDVLEAQLEFHLDRRLRSLRFLRQMRRAQPAPDRT